MQRTVKVNLEFQGHQDPSAQSDQQDLQVHPVCHHPLACHLHHNRLCHQRNHNRLNAVVHALPLVHHSAITAVVPCLNKSAHHPASSHAFHIVHNNAAVKDPSFSDTTNQERIKLSKCFKMLN